MTARKQIAHQMVEIMPLLMRNMGVHMRCHGDGLVPAHMRLLGMLSKRTFNLTELAEMQSVTLATMSNSVAILAERGLVERLPGLNDRRVVQVRLTEHGQVMLQHVTLSLEEQFARRLEELSVDDLQALGDGLTVLARVLASAAAPAATCNELDS